MNTKFINDFFKKHSLYRNISYGAKKRFQEKSHTSHKNHRFYYFKKNFVFISFASNY